MVRGNELNDAWMVHWLGCTQSEIINVYCNAMWFININLKCCMGIGNVSLQDGPWWPPAAHYSSRCYWWELWDNALLHCQHVPLHEKRGCTQILPSPSHEEFQNLQLTLTNGGVLGNGWQSSLLQRVVELLRCLPTPPEFHHIIHMTPGIM